MAERVPFFDYRPECRPYRAELEDAVRRVLDSGRLILGLEVSAFETEFAEWIGGGEAVGVASGTDALILALRALEIGAGDEVITVSNAGVPVVAAIRATGAVPRFVDVEPDTLQLDPRLLDGAASSATRCVIPVHLYGRPAPLGPILEWADRRGLPLIEDCAQGHGTRYRERHVGTFGRIGCFSFYPTKNLGALGDGGLCVSQDPDLLERLRMLRMYGFDERREARVEGLNSRLDELQAALLRVRLRRLGDAVDERRRLAAVYRRELEGSGLLVPDCEPAERHSHHLFIVRVKDRAHAMLRFEEQGVGFGLHYPMAVHRMEAYRGLPDAGSTLPETESACREVFSLPLYPGLTRQAQQRVCEVLLSVV